MLAPVRPPLLSEFRLLLGRQRERSVQHLMCKEDCEVKRKLVLWKTARETCISESEYSGCDVCHKCGADQREE